MIRALVRVSAVLALGTIVTAALFWALLIAPESNVLMLALSALLAVMIVAIVAVTVNTAILVARGASSREALLAGPRGTGWFLVAFAPLVIAWFAVGRFDRWVLDHQGEINAWFIAQYGWTDITWLLQSELWMSRWLRWAMLPMACLSLLASLLTSDTRHAWLRRAFHWRTMLLATTIFVLLMVAPWQLTAWRPTLPPTWLQPAVAAVRLGAAFVLALIGAAVFVIISAQPAKVETSREIL